MALWPDSLESSWGGGGVSPPFGPQGRRKVPWGHFSQWTQGAFPRSCGPILQNPIVGEAWWEVSQPIGPQGRRKCPWGHLSHWPQGPFLRPSGRILLNPLGEEAWWEVSQPIGSNGLFMALWPDSLESS